MKLQKKAYLFAFAAIACWSTIGSAFKISLRWLSPVELLFFSSFTACLVLLSILLVQRKLSLLRSLTSRQVAHSALLGLLNPFLYYLVLLKGYDILPAQEAGTLNYIWPLILVLLSIPMLKQKISLLSILAILLSFAGILIIASHPSAGSPPGGNPYPGGLRHVTGVVLAVGSALFWALYWILNIKDKREAVTKLFLNFCFGFFYTLMAVAITGKFRVPVWQGLAGAIYIGFFEMGITFVLWLNALKFSSTTAKVSNLIYLSPFISLVFIHFTVGETIYLSTVTGLVFLVTGIVWQQYLKR
ncbi:MAG: DMT family transporter [Bacteroidota bacterium]